MERKKPDKHQYATPISNSSYIYNLEEAQFCQSNNNMKDSLFFKYASSIIHVVPEDKLDLSSKNGCSQEQRETIFEISQVNDFQVDFFSRAIPVDQEQNNYNNIAAKMKKKTTNKKLLAYNFSNFTIFIEKIDEFGRKQLKYSLEALRLHSNSSQNTKNKKEIKRASFYSGYTTSTSNEQNNIKKNSKKLMEQKKREDKKEAANRVKGFIEYKMLMNYNQAFQDLRDYVQAYAEAMLKVSDVSTVKNGNQILQNFYLTQPNNDHSISIVRDLQQNIQSSLVYTADLNFQFTQKEVTLTTPEKFGSSIGKFGITQKLLNKPTFNSHQQSFVQSYRPKDNFPSTTSPRKFPPKDTHLTTISKPIQFHMTPERRHLIIRTNCYELPLISDHYLTINKERNYKDLTIMPDHCTKNEPETSNGFQAIFEQLLNATNLLGNSQAKSNKSIDSSINTRNANVFSPKISKLQSTNSKYNVDKSTQNFHVNSQFKSTLHTLTEKKQSSDKGQNYYFLNHKNQELQKIKSNISPQKFQPQMIKVIPSDKKQSYALSPQTKEVIKKSQKLVRFDESAVHEIKMDENVKIGGFNKLQLQSKNINVPLKSRQDKKQVQQISTSRNQKIKSISKINLVMQSPQKETIHKPVYYSPRQMVKQQPRNHYNYEKSPRINSPYGYATPVQRPKVSAFKQAQPIRQFQPQHTYREIPKQNMTPSYSNNIYQINQKPTMINASNKQNIGTPQKSLRPNQNIKTQYQYRVENIYPQYPGKVINPGYMINNLDKRQNMIVQNQQKVSRQDSGKKQSFYSPQVMKDPYLFSPQKVMVHQIQEPKPQKNCPPIPQSYIKQQYFTNNNQGRTQQLHKAVNFNNNYYTNNTATNQIRQTQVVKNVFKQQERPRTNHFKERPPSSRLPQQRVNIFSNYSPLDSQLESQQRSNHFSKNSSQISRPKSMNEKIFITLRKDK